jgi:hypothetical protein
MHSTETLQMQALGEIGEPCAGCGTPLAADQRYCLNCGQRRAGPRVDFRRYLLPSAGEAAPPESPPAPAAGAPPDSPEPGRDYAPLAAVGGIAVLGLMLLVGVLIGKGNNSAAPAPAPILKVPESVAPSTAGTESNGSKTTSAKPQGSSNKSKEKSGTGAKPVAGGLTGEAASQSKGTVQASKGDLESLNDQTGDSYQEAVKKLPDKIATPGAPPPIDKTKPPGGGGGAVTIE